jgi:hypothetical protein
MVSMKHQNNTKVSGQRSAVSGQRSAVSGQRSAVSENYPAQNSLEQALSKKIYF